MPIGGANMAYEHFPAAFSRGRHGRDGSGPDSGVQKGPLETLPPGAYAARNSRHSLSYCLYDDHFDPSNRRG